MRTLIKLFPILVIISCNNSENSKNRFTNIGITTVLNGRNEIDSLKYKCDSCFELLKDKSVFDTVISIASTEAKGILKNKLSFRPLSVDLMIIRHDSLYYTSGKRIDSLVAVYAEYKCIGKNGYGVEDEVESTSIIYLINNKVVNLDGKIRKESLKLREKGAVSRNLILYGDKSTIMIQPVKIKGDIHLIVTGNESCVENTRLNISLDQKKEITITSWNKFNCDNTSYFLINTSHLALLKDNPIQYISLSGDEFIFCSVPENEKDYFIQYASLLIE